MSDVRLTDPMCGSGADVVADLAEDARTAHKLAVKGR